MNDKFKIFFVAIIFGCIIAPSVFCQSPTTEGTEFWLSFMANEKTPELSINVSAKRACTLTIKNINTGYVATATLKPGLNKLSPNLTPNTQCYVTSSEIVENKSLLITSTDTISLFANNYVSQLFDVTGVLPINALLDEYMIQTYPNSSKKQSYPPEFLIIATEDNTTVDITPTWNTGGSMIKDQTYSISLKKGQSYQVQAKTDLGSTFSGSLVKSRNGKKIAVFNGNRSEGIQDNSGNTSDGDHLFEQAVPVAFWGTKFVLSRSLNRAIDRFQITALNNDTKILRDGINIKTLQSGQTFEIELVDPNTSSYIETSCPCAVYQYLVSRHKYDTSNSIGGPSMIWISPIEQMIKDINFCTYQTSETSNHYVNIVTLTNYTSKVSLTGKNTGNKTLSFNPVTGNSDYSYARISLSDDSYSLKTEKGAIAYVYGLGSDESYGYSAGSSAKIQKGISINDIPFLKNFPDSISTCLGDSVSFSAEMRNIESIEWNLGNGVIKSDSTFKYKYSNPGQFQVQAIIKSFTNLCDLKSLYDTIRVKIKVTSPKIINHYIKTCLLGNLENSLSTFEKIDTLNYQCDSIVYIHNIFNYETYFTDKLTAYDSLTWRDGKTYFQSTNTPTVTLKNAVGCDSVITLNLSILECLDISLGNTSVREICSNEPNFTIPYQISKGAYNRFSAAFDSVAVKNGFSGSSVIDNGSAFIVTIPNNVTPNNYLLKLILHDDLVCNRHPEFQIPFTIKYSGLIKQKWNDVLAISSHSGYDFTAFQWYKNGTALTGETGPYYYVGPDGSELDFNADYSVELTRTDGIKLMSCFFNPQKNNLLSNIIVYPTSLNSGDIIHIITDEDCSATLVHPVGINQTKYDLKSGDNSINQIVTSGIYILNILTVKGYQQSFKIIVK